MKVPWGRVALWQRHQRAGEYGLFRMIPFRFVAAPLCAWLLLDTGARRIDAWSLAA